MAENINIGSGTGDMSDKNKRALDLYGAFSLAEDKFVDEMLSDETAEKIRAANRRKTLRFRSSVAACAAAVAIVVGIGVIPKHNLDTAKSSKNAGGSNYAAAEKSEAAPQSDNAPNYDGVVGESAEEEAGTNDDQSGAAAPEVPMQAYDEAPADKGSEEIGYSMGSAGGSGKSDRETAAAEEETDNAVSDSAGDEDPELLYTGVYLTFKDGTNWFVGDRIGTDNRGKRVYDENGYVVYTLKGFDPGYMVAVMQGNSCFAAITADFQTGTLAELSGGLNFKDNLYLDYYMTDGETQGLDDSLFRNSALKILTDHAGDYKLDRDFENIDLIGSDGNYVCRIGTEDECFIEPIYITIHDKAILVVCYNAAALFVAE